MASSGKKPIIEFPDTDQAMAAFGKLATTVASASYLSGGQMKLPMVILVPVGLDGNMSAYANNAESFFASVPGIKVLAPANPAQAKGLLKAAVLDDGPVVLFENMEVEIIKDRYPHDQETIDAILTMMLDTICSKRKTIRIAGDDKPVQVVKAQFLKLNSMHLQYVLECMKNNAADVRNIKQYMLATIYNAPNTMNSYYRQMVNHDMASGKK